MASIDAAALGVVPDADAKAEGTTATIDYKPDAPWSNEETEKVKKMRSILESELKIALLPRDLEYWGSDRAMHRVLVARALNVDAAVEMWRHIAAFRSQRKCCDLLDGPKVYREPETLRRYFPWGFAGLDKDGYPVLVERIGCIDLIGIGQSAAGSDGQYEPFLQWVCWYHEVQERMLRAATSAAGGRDRHKMTCIIDLAGLSMRHCSTSTLAVLKRRTRLEEDNYPEVVRQVYLINAPSIFSSVWGIVKRFVDPGTAAKFNICGGPEVYLPLLQAKVGEQSIPAFLYPQSELAKTPGVGMRDSSGDTECARLICPGGLVPLAYLHPSVTLAGDGRGAGEEVHIAAGKASEVLLHVPPGALVRWGWATAEKDVAFTVQYGPAASAAALPHTSASTPAHLVVIDRSVCGVHCLGKHYASLPQPVPNPYTLPATVPGAVVAGGDGGTLPCLATGTQAACPPSSTATVPAPGTKLGSHSGSFTLPTASAAGYIVRLRWDNGFSWMSGKSLARRVDVILPGDLHQDELEREQGAGPVGVAGGIHRAADVQDEQARAREKHREGSHAAIAS